MDADTTSFDSRAGHMGAAELFARAMGGCSDHPFERLSPERVAECAVALDRAMIESGVSCAVAMLHVYAFQIMKLTGASPRELNAH